MPRGRNWLGGGSRKSQDLANREARPSSRQTAAGGRSSRHGATALWAVCAAIVLGVAITLASTGVAGPRAAFAAVTGLAQTAQTQAETATTGAADGTEAATTTDAAQDGAAGNASENNGGNTASASPDAADAGQSTAASSMDSRITEFSLKWSTSKNQGEYYELKGNELTLKPAYTYSEYVGSTFPGGTVATAELSLGISAGSNPENEAIEAGKLMVEIPAYIFNKRDTNKAQGGFAVGISTSESGDNILKYAFNDHGTPDDTSDDTIDITNKSSISASYRWTVEIAYYSVFGSSEYAPQVSNGIRGNTTDIAGGEGDRGYHHQFRARLNVEDKSGNAANRDSRELGVRYRTQVGVRVHKSLEASDEKNGFAFLTKVPNPVWWTSTNRQVPPDADKYFYALWHLNIGYTKSTQDGVLRVVDTPDPSSSGEIVGWLSSRYAYKAPESDGSYSWELGDYWPVGVLVRYPKTLLEKGAATLKNKVDVTYDGKDGDSSTASSQASRTWNVQEFTYPPGNYEPLKESAADTHSLAINRLEASSKDEFTTDEYTYNFGSNNYGTDLVFEPGADKLKDQPTRKWSVDTYDDFVGISQPDSESGVRLGSQDYAMTSFAVLRPFEQMVEEDPTGKNPYQFVTSPKEKWPVVTIWYETSLDSEPGYDKSTAWHELGKLHYSDLTEYKEKLTFTYVDGKSIDDVMYRNIQLPDNVVGIRYTYDTYSVRSMLSLRVNVRLRATDRVVGLIKGQQSARLTNIMSMGVYDDKGNFVNASSDSSILPQAYRNDVIAHDKTFDTRGFFMHKSAYKELGRSESESYTSKKVLGVKSGTNDPSTSSVKVTYALNATETMKADTSLEEAEKFGFHEQRGGVFYELLPSGMTVDSGSVRAWQYDGGYEPSRFFAGQPDPSYVNKSVPEAASTVNLIENWRGSGRTMLVVRVQAKDGSVNSNKYHGLHSGFHVEFTASYPWQSFDDYGSSVKNIAAFRSSGEISGGHADDGKFSGGVGMPSFSDADSELMKDLDNNGNPADEPSNVVYMSNSATLQKLGSTQVTTGKFVRAAGNAVWKTGDTDDGEEQVTSGQGYSYQLSLRGGQSDGDKPYTKAKGIVMYDNLEDFADTQSPARARWHGTINSVDLSLAKLRGISPKVYYATETRDLSEAANRDLTDASKWTPTDESFSNVSDKSQVKAIAIDLGTKSDGSEFVLNGDTESIRAVINMTAPTKGAYQLQQQGAVALNDAYLVANVESTAGLGWGQAQLPAGPTRVSISADVASFEFEKRGGEDDQAAPVDGAVFRLWRWTGSGEAPTGLIDPDNPGEGWELATDEATGNPVGDANGNVTSGADGTTGLVSFPNLDKGTYRLVEVKAPTGFMLPSGQWSVIVDPALSTSYKVMVSAIAGADGKLPPAFGVKGSGTDASLYVGNKPVPYLPSSGAAGTLLLTGAGLALVGAAAVLAWRHVRATREDTSAS